MTDEDDEKVKPAPYPKSDTQEHDAVDLLNYILDASVKSYVDSRDKAPNHDGWLELVDEDDSPIGRIVVQVKKLPDGDHNEIKKQLETRHLSYCYSCIAPFFILLVDVDERVVYWKHITEAWFEENELHSQKYKTVTFSPEDCIREDKNSYVEEWREIVNRTKQQVKNYDEYQKLKARSNPAIGTHQPDFRDIHNFLDSYHHLLDTKFKIVKEKAYPDVWKVGFGKISYKEDELSYTLYPIEMDENDAQIRDIDRSWEEVHQLGANAISGHNFGNPLLKDPKKFAYNAIERSVERIIEEKDLDYSGCTFLAAEYLYDFVEKYHELLGLEEKENYSTKEIRDGYYRYLQYWLSDEIRDILTEHSIGEVHISLDGYLTTDREHYKRAHEFAKKKSKDATSDPPRHEILLEDHDQDLVESFIDVLANSSVDKLKRPFRGRDVENNDTSSILGYYSDEAIFENIETYYYNYHSEYAKVAENNFPEFADEISIKHTNHLLIVISENKGDSFFKWNIATYWLESGCDEFKVDCHWDTDPEIPDDLVMDHQVEYDGTKYHAPVYGHGGDMVLTEIDSSYESLLDDVHEKLGREVRSFMSEKKVPREMPN